MSYEVTIKIDKDYQYKLSELLTITNVDTGGTPTLNTNVESFPLTDGGVVTSQTFQPRLVYIDFVMTGNVEKKKDSLFKILSVMKIEPKRTEFSDLPDRHLLLTVNEGCTFEKISNSFAKGRISLIAPYPFYIANKSRKAENVEGDPQSYKLQSKGTAPSHLLVEVFLEDTTRRVTILTNGKVLQVGTDGGENLGEKGDMLVFDFRTKRVTFYDHSLSVVKPAYTTPVSVWSEMQPLTDKQLLDGVYQKCTVNFNPDSKACKTTVSMVDTYL